MTHPQDATAVFACFTVPGVVAGGLVGAVMHREARGALWAAARGAFLGGGGATVVGALLSVALRAGIEH